MLSPPRGKRKSVERHNSVSQGSARIHQALDFTPNIYNNSKTGAFQHGWFLERDCPRWLVLLGMSPAISASVHKSVSRFLCIYKVIISSFETGPSPPLCPPPAGPWVFTGHMLRKEPGGACLCLPVPQTVYAALRGIFLCVGGVHGHTALFLSPLSICFWRQALYSRHAHGGSWIDP